MPEMFTVITTVGGLCGACVTMIGFFTIVLKKPKAWIKAIAKDVVTEDLKDIKSMLTTIKEQLNLEQESTVCSLRHSITNIYEKYHEKKVLPANVKKDLCSLYEKYSAMNGNSYVHFIFEEMMDWETK